MTGCWFTSSIWFISTSWIVAGLLGNPTQLLYNQPSLMLAGCFPTPLCCKCLIISMNKSRKHSFCCHFSTPLALTNSLSLNTCYFDCWLQVATSTITLTNTLLILGGLNVVVALKLISLVLNMFSTSNFRGHCPNLCSTRINYIGIMTGIFLGLTSWVLIPTINFVYLTITIGTTGTSFFLLWHVSTKWLILPQLIQVHVDLIVIACTIGFTPTLTFGVVNITL